jgi:putative protein kinase ArgK-like GTPase of G3E family
MKKGIVELTDLILVNKADGNLAPAARLAQVSIVSWSFAGPKLWKLKQSFIKDGVH